MALTPAQLASTWTWFGTGVSTIVTKPAVKKAVVSTAKAVLKTVA